MSENPIYKSLISSKDWRKLRRNYLEEHPVCEICEKEGRTTQAEEVHHKTPVQTGQTYIGMKLLCFQWSNLQSLCKECHHKVHEDTVRSWSKEKNRAKAQRIVDGFVAEFLVEPPRP